MVGIAQTVDFIPWCVKFIWAIPSDAYNFFGFGHRRPYIVMGLSLAGLCFVVLATFDPGQYIGLYMVTMITRNIGIAVADCAVDGFSVDAQLDEESGALQGWMSLGRTAGTVLGAIVGGYIAETLGFGPTLLALGLFTVLPIPMNFMIKEEWDDSKVFAPEIEGAAAVAAASEMLHESDSLLAEKAGAAASPSTFVLTKPAESSRTASVMLRLTLQAETAETTKGHHLHHNREVFASLAVAAKAEIDSSKSVRNLLNEGDAVAAALALAKRPSFGKQVAKAIGFDFDLLGDVLYHRHIIMFLLWLALATLGIAFSNFIITDWALKSGVLGVNEGEPILKVGTLMAAMSIGCFIVSLPMGYLFDALPSKRTAMIIASVFTMICNTLPMFCKTEATAFISIFLFGAAHGALYVVQCSMARVLAEPRIAAAFFGLINSICNLMHAIGTLVGGPLSDGSGPHLADPIPDTDGFGDPKDYYDRCFLMGGSCGLASLIFVFFISEAKMRLLEHNKEGPIEPHAWAIAPRPGLELEGGAPTPPDFSKLRSTVLNSMLREMSEGQDWDAEGGSGARAGSRRPVMSSFDANGTLSGGGEEEGAAAPPAFARPGATVVANPLASGPQPPRLVKLHALVQQGLSSARAKQAAVSDLFASATRESVKAPRLRAVNEGLLLRSYNKFQTFTGNEADPAVNKRLRRNSTLAGVVSEEADSVLPSRRAVEFRVHPASVYMQDDAEDLFPPSPSSLDSVRRGSATKTGAALSPSAGDAAGEDAHGSSPSSRRARVAARLASALPTAGSGHEMEAVLRDQLRDAAVAKEDAAAHMSKEDALVAALTEGVIHRSTSGSNAELHPPRRPGLFPPPPPPTSTTPPRRASAGPEPEGHVLSRLERIAAIAKGAHPVPEGGAGRLHPGGEDTSPAGSWKASEGVGAGSRKVSALLPPAPPVPPPSAPAPYLGGAAVETPGIVDAFATSPALPPKPVKKSWKVGP